MMKKFVLDYINTLEGYKTAIKSLHWNSKNLSQHKLCDDIAGKISDFQDQIAEVEQSINGNLPFNKLKGRPYKVKSLVEFMDDVLKSTVKFYNKLKHKNDNYIGMRSDCESFLSEIQRLKYLVNFTLKESLARRRKNRLIEQVLNEEDVRYVVGNGIDHFTLTGRELSNLIAESVRKGMRRFRCKNRLIW